MEAKDVYCEEVWERKLKPILDIADMLYILESSKERKNNFSTKKDRYFRFSNRYNRFN